MLSLATSSLLASQGQVLGISGIAHSVASDNLSRRTRNRKVADASEREVLNGKATGKGKGPSEGTAGWKVACVGGLLVGGYLLNTMDGRTMLGSTGVFDPPTLAGMNMGRTVLAGFAVGIGTKVSQTLAQDS